MLPGVCDVRFSLVGSTKDETDLQALTLVGPSGEDPVLEPLAVLHLHRLCI